MHFKNVLLIGKKENNGDSKLIFLEILYDACITIMSLLAFNDLSCHVIKTN